ncbi:hypothetical protein CAPTEDRAFT_227629 [Capitella teleta]|uniref:Transmembrane protein 254 n=1 Tax=Capitella teleta TaxID=283909 RepID=R7VIL4_CAPTE|nr:hypothetical protein CAPTEDRAFT_227629 [Capitella teleta]|eukprot:ELU18392.1 hypothetical protein CAPTEDRAFT_227629 [Capitella teleta]
MVELNHSYFESPHIVWLISIPAALGLLSAACLCPAYLPYAYLGPIGSLTRVLVDDYPSLVAFLFYTTWLLHVLEAYMAARLCSRLHLWSNNTWKWVIQTFVFGVFSLRLLKAHERQLKRQS